jgi:hypothetical protein
MSEVDMATLVAMVTKLLQSHFDRQAQRQGQFVHTLNFVDFFGFGYCFTPTDIKAY